MAGGHRVRQFTLSAAYSPGIVKLFVLLHTLNLGGQVSAAECECHITDTPVTFSCLNGIGTSTIYAISDQQWFWCPAGSTCCNNNCGPDPFCLGCSSSSACVEFSGPYSNILDDVCGRQTGCGYSLTNETLYGCGSFSLSVSYTCSPPPPTAATTTTTTSETAPDATEAGSSSVIHLPSHTSVSISISDSTSGAGSGFSPDNETFVSWMTTEGQVTIKETTRITVPLNAAANLSPTTAVPTFLPSPQLTTTAKTTSATAMMMFFYPNSSVKPAENVSLNNVSSHELADFYVGTNKSAIIAGVVCGVCGVAILAALVVVGVVLWKRRHAPTERNGLREQKTPIEQNNFVVPGGIQYKSPVMNSVDSQCTADCVPTAPNTDEIRVYNDVKPVNDPNSSQNTDSLILIDNGLYDRSDSGDYGGVTLVDSGIYDQRNTGLYGGVTLVDNALYNSARQ